MSPALKQMKIKESQYTIQQFEAQYLYDFETGNFTHKSGPNAGLIAGAHDSDGYVLLYMDGLQFRAHRVAWLFEHGTWPQNEIDHKNRMPHDNRIDNLREASRTMNMINRRPNRNSGYRGVTKNNVGFTARITVNMKTYYLGNFKTPEEAHEAYCRAAPKYHGEFARSE